MKLSLNEYITEHFVNATSKSEIEEIMDKYGDQILQIIDDGYRDIGGAIGFDTKEHIIEESDFVKLYRKDEDIYAVVFYAKKRHPNVDAAILSDDRTKNFGRKICCCAAKKGYGEYLGKIIKEDFKVTNRNVWGEFSGKMATFALKCGAIPVPAEAVQSILSNKIFTDLKDDGFFYTREIGGHKHTKVLMGNHLFYTHNVDEKLSAEDIQKFKDLAIKYSKE